MSTSKHLMRRHSHVSSFRSSLWLYCTGSGQAALGRAGTPQRHRELQGILSQTSHLAAIGVSEFMETLLTVCTGH